MKKVNVESERNDVNIMIRAKVMVRLYEKKNEIGQFQMHVHKLGGRTRKEENEGNERTCARGGKTMTRKEEE
jgi:hypothetical protein